MKSAKHRFSASLATVGIFRIHGALLLLALALIGSNSNAATVTYTLDLRVANQFEVRASSSIGDNGGIRTYGIPLLGSVLTLDHRSPNVFKLGPNGNSGFSNLRSADLPAGSANPTITGQQELITPNLVYGFGQTPGAFSGVFFSNDATSDTTWSAPLLIARGTYNMAAGTLQFNSGSATLLANVFDNGTGNESVAAQVATRIIPFGFVEYNDYNKDGKWDAADYVLWRKTMGQFGFDLPADGNNSGLVDSEDYDIWHTSFGEDTSPGGGSSTNIPEPSSLTFVALAMLGIAPKKGSGNEWHSVSCKPL